MIVMRSYIMTWQGRVAIMGSPALSVGMGIGLSSTKSSPVDAIALFSSRLSSRTLLGITFVASNFASPLSKMSTSVSAKHSVLQSRDSSLKFSFFHRPWFFPKFDMRRNASDPPSMCIESESWGRIRGKWCVDLMRRVWQSTIGM